MEKEQLDPWTDGLKANHPDIWQRCENFLEACAQAAGRDRKAQPQEEHKSFKVWDFNPSTHDDWMRKMHERHDVQKRATDARNLKILQKLIEKKISISGALRQNGMSSVKSLESTLKASYDRGGYGENAWMYDRFKEMRNKGQLKPDAKGRKATIIVFDGRNFVERKQ